LSSTSISYTNSVFSKYSFLTHFEKYGLSPDERILFYLINEEEIIEFENGQEDFIAWVLERGGIIK
jgi:hypothetical protein